jgi:mannan endo-1,4-beta-mannosidase
MARVARRDVLSWSAAVAGGFASGACTRRSAEETPVFPAAPIVASGGGGAGEERENARRRRSALPGGLEVRGTRFFRGGRVFFVNGVNHWAAPTLARTDNPAGWDQLRRDLDQLQGIGVNVLRVMASTEGAHTDRRRIVPAIQPAPGRYDSAGVEGVLRLAEEMQRRGLYGIFVLNNFWSWSGGMAQYRAWAEGESIPWYDLGQYAGGFFANAAARALSYAYVRVLVPQLRSNPAVIWELANEPRKSGPSYAKWLREAATLVKSLAPAQLLTTGSEGDAAGLGIIDEHRIEAIDFATHHMWAQNWGWVSPATLAVDFDSAVSKAHAYMGRHALLAAQLGKPIVLEEFGFPRDGGSCDPASTTVLRDAYFRAVYEMIRALCEEGPMAGVLPWAWAGESRPPRPGAAWRTGDPLTGDPPHEPQGWYSIYGDDSTVGVLRECGAELLALAKA